MAFRAIEERTVKSLVRCVLPDDYANEKEKRVAHHMDEFLLQRDYVELQKVLDVEKGEFMRDNPLDDETMSMGTGVPNSCTRIIIRCVGNFSEDVFEDARFPAPHSGPDSKNHNNKSKLKRDVHVSLLYLQGAGTRNLADYR